MSDLESTVVVDRGLLVDDETVVVDRGRLPVDDSTVVVDRGSVADDATVVVERGVSDATIIRDRGVPVAEPLAHPPVMNAPTRRRRRTPAPAPVDESVLNTAEKGPGPGILDRYEARAVAASLVAPPTFDAGREPTRDASAVLPSVARASRRSGVAAVVAFAVSCVVSVVGLAVIAVTVLGDLFG